METEFEKYFYFDLDKIIQEINKLIEKGKLDTAKDLLEKIQNSYIKNKHKLNFEKPPFEHLMLYSLESLFDENSNGTTVIDFFLKSLNNQLLKINTLINLQPKFNSGMNYLEIVLKAYFNENNREFIDSYFLREFKKAEKEHYTADEFFNGCLKVINSWENYLEQKVNERKWQLHLMLSEAKNNTLSYGDIEGKTIEQKRKETIEYCEQELQNIRPDGIGSLTFQVHLSSLTNGRILYNMPFNELLFIKDAISRAYKNKLRLNQLELDEQIKQEPRKYKSEHFPLAYIFECNSKGESIPFGSKKELEKIGKKRVNGAISPNTFYKAVNRIFESKIDLNSEKSLVEIAGEDWRAILFELTDQPIAIELEKYLQSKQL